MNSAIYDGGLVDAAKAGQFNPSMGLTALQVSGAMPRPMRNGSSLRHPLWI
jgi:hypothetical protein